MVGLHALQQITLFFYFIEVAFWFFISLWKRKKITIGSVETTILPGAIVLYLALALAYRFQANLLLLAVGLGISLLGSLFIIVAFFHLGWLNSDDFWGGRFENKPRHLVITGPYVYIRHPIYVGLILHYSV